MSKGINARSIEGREEGLDCRGLQRERRGIGLKRGDLGAGKMCGVCDDMTYLDTTRNDKHDPPQFANSSLYIFPHAQILHLSSNAHCSFHAKSGPGTMEDESA
jgi:hypothetical protein